MKIVIRRSEVCLFCDRKLRSPRSILRGYGLACGKKSKAALNDLKLRQDGNVPLFDPDGNPNTQKESA